MIGQENTETTDVQAVIDTLTKEGIEWTGRTSDMAENIQPRFQANIHKEFFTEQDLSKSTRQAIRTARNKGIQVQFGGTELLEDFASLMKKTEARKSIHLRGKDYYEKLLTTYQGQSYITLSTLDLEKRKTSLIKDLEKTRQRLKNSQKKQSLARLRTTKRKRADRGRTAIS